VIMGYAEMALDKLPAEDSLHGDLREIQDAAKRSMELTRQLLAFARQQPIVPKVLDINQAVAGMLKMLQRLIGEDIELHWHPGGSIWPILIDPSQIDQMLANLSVNARDAITGVGKIIINTSNTKLDKAFCALNPGASPGEFVKLEVGDDGIGMEAAVLDKIFEPFFSTKAVGRGTGLGLATVYGIVKQNKGYISAHSEPGRGSTFKIYLPRITGRDVETIVKSPAETALGDNETVLLVEDDIAMLELVERLLTQLGYRVLAAKSPLEAITLAELHPEKIDLLVTDVIMPELNGRDLANRLRNLYPGLRVLFMSGYTANIVLQRGVQAKEDFLLQKPFSKKELAAKVKEVLTFTPASRLAPW
jgi:two-component system cell cycle sensor histidine kinase/response regulator CckA